MNTPYHDWIRKLAELLEEGKSLPFGGFPHPTFSSPGPNAPRALIFSPHPDDECIIGGLPLRLARELGWKVGNVAVTLGSLQSRRAERLEELRGACDHLGFDLIELDPAGLEQVHLKGRQQDPERWARSVSLVRDVLRAEQPDAIFFPHERDWNGTHIGVHHLVLEALSGLGEDFRTRTFETEFWGAMDAPNLTVQIPPDILGDLMAALSFHVGEIQRNPYHLLTPAWMQDNVRRGGELVGGQGGAAPDFLFATLYRHGCWAEGALHLPPIGGRMVGSTHHLQELLDWQP